ncbi:hypothetical protein Syun_004159 [Stephania yunnanensis]|uniref:Cyclin-dependent kinase inhibitor domain-containing protein n=1 Tax=Stephania yunnanensis TaxID=152371 RepID=A0AAP0L2I1_9MAGN
MRRYMRKCKSLVGEIAVIHHHHHHEVGVITRARALAMANAAGAHKRKRLDASQEEEAVVVRVRSRGRVRIISTPDNVDHHEDDVVFVNVSGGGGGGGGGGNSASSVSPARCSSNGSWSEEQAVRRSEDADLNKGEGIEFESSATSFSHCTLRSRREPNQLSDLISLEFEEYHHHQDPSMESSTGSLSHRSSTTSKKQENNNKKKSSAAEIEEFLSAMEKDSQKRFAEKYNYDIVKDVPLEGRYEWVQLKP